MFIQIIQGQVSNPDELNRQVARWRLEIKPGAAGYLGSTGGVTPDGRGITLVRFESEAAARANSERPEQGAWWSEAEKAYEDVGFHHSSDVDVVGDGGSNKAGFVQVIQGRTTDQEEFRRVGRQLEEQLGRRRPDILGSVVAWHGDGGFTQAVYFTSAEAARQGEAASRDDESAAEMMNLMDGQPTYFDLDPPDLD